MSAGARELRALLCRWYATEKRDLPWRRTRDPYAIWISETMLQQTRVEAVIPYYHRFLERFPTIADLARASEDDVVAAWSGLGYYRRARALREAARTIVERHEGRFPDRSEDALALPGIGPYTAGAVLSIAYGRSQPLVDGNVARVFARLFALDEPLDLAAARRRLWELARELVPPEDTPGGEGPGDWNQALMELGATTCTARSPRCLVCPLVERCAARRAGRVGELPLPARRRAPVDVELEVLFVCRGGEVLLERRPRTGRMAGMWELPTREVAGAGASGLWPASWGLSDVRTGDQLGEVRHGITHHRIRAIVRRAAGIRARVLSAESGNHETDGACWVPLDDLDRLALTGMTRKILARPFVRAELQGAFPACILPTEGPD
ncbi:MAG: A/G-specific adenine glycosylase [Planctomycetota bacterium]|nr:A/G-specific adenine glycosylase [Planctomycetota bacterium]